jgi:hypothetical protein
MKLNNITDHSPTHLQLYSNYSNLNKGVVHSYVIKRSNDGKIGGTVI